MSKNRKKKKGRDLSKIKIPVWAKPEKQIWVEIRDNEDLLPINYYEATVISSDETTKKIKVTYTTSNTGPDSVWADRISERAEVPQTIEDLVDIEPLNDAELLRCLQVRFENDDIACFCGPTLIATNPYKRIKKATLKEDKIMFKKYALGEGKIISKPHIWNTAARTFRQIFDNKKKQAVCISGESGAGKTFLTEMVMAFITSLFEDEEGGRGSGDEVPIEKKILGCNPIMENFGNSKTVRNDNSSRFGKYFIMYVDKQDKHIYGAQIKNYLLEKSRIITQAKTERNYHIFYGIMKFMEAERLKEYGFCNDGDKPKMEEFDYLKKSECYSLPLKKDAKDDEYEDPDEEFYVETCNSLKNLGFSDEESEAIFKILSCVLNLGNVPIDTSTYEEGESPCKLTKNDYLEKVLKNLNLEYEDLSDSCCSKVRKMPDGTASVSPRTASQSESIRDALAKDLYNNCFNWVIRKLNLTLLPENVEKYTSVGLLDIFGFEDFNSNSLEQFCINFTNEKLQSLYNSYVFQAEIDTYKIEGLDEFIHLIQFTSNDPVMDLMAKNKRPPGIFNLIDSVALQATNDKIDYDKRLITNILKTHKDNEFFFANRLKPDLFGIKHTAKDVFYTIQGFVEKNKDELPFNLVDALNKGDKEIVKIFNLKLTHDEVKIEKKKDSKEKFLGYKFKKEMESLMDELLACECNFVRAIKPNEQKTRDLWVPELALCQIKYLGILDSINVRRDSLPVRKKFMDFYEKYQDLDQKSKQRSMSFLKLKKKNPDWKTLSLNIIKSLQNVNENEIITGKTRIFMSVNFQNYMLEELEEKQKIKKAALLKIIDAFKRYDFSQDWNYYKRRQLAVLKITSNFKILDFAQNWNILRKNTAGAKAMSKNLLMSWNSKIDYGYFRKFLYFVKKGQEIFRTKQRKKEMRRKWDSAIIIGRAYNIYRIRVVMTNAKRVITALKKCSRKILFKAIIARIRISKRVLDECFEKAWIEILEIENGNAVRTIQRICRGHISRLRTERINASETTQRIWRGYYARFKNQQDVENYKKAKQDIKEMMAAREIQSAYRGFRVRNTMDRLHRAAYYIQGHVRMLWLTKYFKIMRAAALKIQNLAKKYLAKKLVIQRREAGYYEGIETERNLLRSVESEVIFNQKNGVENFEVGGFPIRLNWLKENSKFKSKIPDIESFIPKIPDFDQTPMMKIFSILIDFDCHFDTRNIYRDTWGVDYLKFQKEIQKKNSRLLHLEAGNSFTLAFTKSSKIYSWGLNDNSQLARPKSKILIFNPPKISKKFNRIETKTISCGDDHALIVDYSGNLYTWGANFNGQLGLGNCQEKNLLIKLKQFENKTKMAIANGKISYVLTNKGEIWKWPSLENSSLIPALLPLPNKKFKITNISCGLRFLITITDNGLVYSTGENNEGQLGLGDKKPRKELNLVERFVQLKEKVAEVSCGLGHTIARTSSWKVFVWGYGANGQLGRGPSKSRNVPCMVNPYNEKGRPYKALSVQAGFAVSYILNNDRNVYYAGENVAQRSKKTTFTRLKFERKVFGKENTIDFSPLRLQCSWSKSVTLLCMIYGDFRRVKTRKKKRDELCSAINLQWTEECRNQVFPPVNELTVRNICPRYLKKGDKENFVLGLKQNRRRKKMTLTQRIDVLMQIPKNLWTVEDKDLMKSAVEYIGEI